MNIHEGLIGVEVLGRYDGLAYYVDGEGKRYSLNGLPIHNDELCKHGKIHKVKNVGDCEYEILSSREDI